MATLLEFPRPNGSQTADNGRYQKIMASRFAFWRAHEIQQVMDLLLQEFPGADVRNAMNFARVVVSPSEGNETLTQYVRGILDTESSRLAA